MASELLRPNGDARGQRTTVRGEMVRIVLLLATLASYVLAVLKLRTLFCVGRSLLVTLPESIRFALMYVANDMPRPNNGGDAKVRN